MMSFSKAVTEASQALSIKYNNIGYELKQRGRDLIVLSLGEAYFDLPFFSMNDLPFPDVYHYSHSRGTVGLRQKIAQYYGNHYDVPVDPASEIIVTAGSKAVIHFTLMSVLDPGDEAIIPEPCWVSYPEQVKLCYGKPVMMDMKESIYNVESHITSKTKVIILNNPHNPTGRVYSREELSFLVNVCKSKGIFLLSDEAYSDFVVDEPFVSLGIFSEARDNIIICNSISKNFGISGWRLGYSIASKSLTDQILKVNQHLITCPATILQHYLERHFDEIAEATKPQIKSVVEKRAEVVKMAERMGMTCSQGTSTFYIFLSIAPTSLTSDQFCTRLLMEDGVSAVPGIGYGTSCDSYIRISIGTESMDRIERGLRGIKKLIMETR